MVLNHHLWCQLDPLDPLDPEGMENRGDLPLPLNEQGLAWAVSGAPAGRPSWTLAWAPFFGLAFAVPLLCGFMKILLELKVFIQSSVTLFFLLQLVHHTGFCIPH